MNQAPMPSAPMQGDPLAKLKDVHIPEGVDWWPLAWGWWLLAAVMIVAAVVAVTAWLRHRRFHRARWQAMAEVQRLDMHKDDWASQMNAVLKRAARRYFPIHQVAGLYGRRWQQFLVGQLPSERIREQVEPGLETLQDTLYRPGKADPAHFEHCRKACLMWLKSALLYDDKPQTATAKEASDV